MIPFSVLLSVPVAFLGAVLSLYLLNIENNIYTQVGFVLLFGIACKTAILIVEFAKEQHEKGTPILEAAEYAARLRFRAVLMTAFRSFSERFLWWWRSEQGRSAAVRSEPLSSAGCLFQ